MNRLAQQALLLASLVVLALPALVQAQLILSTNNGQITITGYTGSGGAVTIPGTTNGLPVTSIGKGAFFYCSSLPSVTIPNSVTNIGRDAFGLCARLTGIVVNADSPVYCSMSGVLFDKSQTTLIQYPLGKAESSYAIPCSVTNIGIGAFKYCTRLTSVTIPSSVTSIGDSAFTGCTSLTGIEVNADNPAYRSVDGVLFDKKQTTLIQYPRCKAGSSYAIHNGITRIGDNAFGGCTNLIVVTIPGSVTSIGIRAFYRCRSLTSVTIPNSVTNIGYSAFWRCTSLTSVTIPNRVTSICGWAFSDCASLTSVTIPSRITRVGERAFAYCPRLTSVYFKGNAPRLEDDVFFHSDKAKIYHLPGTTGWSNFLGGRPTAIWNPQTNAPTATGGGEVSSIQD